MPNESRAHVGKKREVKMKISDRYSIKTRLLTMILRVMLGFEEECGTYSK